MIEHGKITTMTDLPGAAGMLASYAKLTANNTKNWSAFEAIALDVLKAVYKAGGEDADASRIAALEKKE